MTKHIQLFKKLNRKLNIVKFTTNNNNKINKKI